MAVRCDPCGLVCIVLVYFIVFYSDYAYVRYILLTTENWISTYFNAVVYQAIVVLLLWSHAKACFSDPGIVPHPRQPLDFGNESEMKQRLLGKKTGDGREKSWSICQKCEMYRPPRAHHCRICKRCIRKMDHHCPWINNCVGEDNQKFFIQFLVYVAVICLYTVISIGISYARTEQPSQQKLIHTIILLIESLLFGIFVVAVLTDQLQAVFSDETTVERCGHSKSVTSKPKKVLLAEVCGTGPLYLWLLPCGLPAVIKKQDQFIV
jgi:hypothetical protein